MIEIVNHWTRVRIMTAISYILFTAIALFVVALLGRYIRRKIRVARILRRIR